LKGINPPIWRRIQVPETYTFWDLHITIQSSMGWENSHLHKFELRHHSSGERACPPEDCGGIWRYEELLEVLKNPDHEDYEEILEWVGEEFDPEHFDVNEVGLNKLNKRKKFLFG